MKKDTKTHPPPHPLTLLENLENCLKKNMLRRKMQKIAREKTIDNQKLFQNNL